MISREFSEANRMRCESKLGFDHPIGLWSLSDWFVAVLGELVEAANLANKLNRIRDGIAGNLNEGTVSDLMAKMTDEIADAVIYLDLLTQAAGIDLPRAVVDKFNRTSAKISFPYNFALPGATGLFPVPLPPVQDAPKTMPQFQADATGQDDVN